MSTGISHSAGKGSNQASKGAFAGGAKAERTRKTYAHEMTEADKFALQAVQRAQGALRTINDAIKSGKKINPDLVKLCFDLSKAVGEMLFATA
jgi:hypothetical protein